MAPDTFPEQVVIGLMSGTSMDSIDAAAVRISLQATQEAPFSRIQTFEMLGALSTDMPVSLQTQLLQMMREPNCISLGALCEINFELGRLFGQTAKALIEQLSTQNIHVDAIASHGQTIYHIPPTQNQPGSTLQITQPAIIAAHCGVPVVADFRPGDMAMGGHGAPLVSFADQLWFGQFQTGRILLNLGGIANITVLPPASAANTAPIAFDTGPANMMIDALMQHFYGQPYDADGRIAAQGQVNQTLLNQWLQHSYLVEQPPKSTGRELFGQPFVAHALNDDLNIGLASADWVTTATAFTAQSITQAIQTFVLPDVEVSKVIAAGGGIQNPTLMAMLAKALRPFDIQLSKLDDHSISGQYKEALAFALLGYARLHGLPNTLPSCTGASQAVSMGGIWLPP